jgi:hypothetical protein
MEKSPAGTRQTYSKSLVWFGKIDYFYLPFLPLNYFMIELQDRNGRSGRRRKGGGGKEKGGGVEGGNNVKINHQLPA